jgi:hypothetical protein
MNLRTVLHLVVLSSGLFAAVHGPIQGAAPKDEPLRYGRIAADGITILNLADEKGKPVAQPSKGQLVAVYKEHVSGWLEVEVPGGFPVWVFGQFLAPSADANVYEVTGSGVNLRPEPSSEVVTNFPLPQRLQPGDKVRGIELQDATKPLSENWVRVWSPPGVRAFVKSSVVEGLGQGEAGAALWSQALASLPSAPPVRVDPARPGATSAADQKDASARAALVAARSALETERKKDTPDYAPIQGELEKLVAAGGPVAVEARAELRTVATLIDAANLRADLERERQRRAEEARAAQEAVWKSSKEKDPFGGVFPVRGVVERRTSTDGIARFFLRFGQDTVCELSCSSGRYDLSTYAGVEVGVHGSEIASRTGEVPTFELQKLEVLAVR